MNKKVAEAYIRKSGIFLGKYGEELNKKAVELISSMATFLNDTLAEAKLNSKNSGISPSQDQNRGDRGSKKEKSGNKPGGQKGHKGNCLRKVENPDKIVNIPIDLSKLPFGGYKDFGYESRQEIDYKVIRTVTEYRAQTVINEFGDSYTAAFPEFLVKPVQYGISLKSHAVYMSQYQLIPYLRLKDYFAYNFNIQLGTGSIYNFNKEVYDKLEDFERWVKEQARKANILCSDETGVNINTQKYWIHTYAGELFKYMFPHKSRGQEAVEVIGILKNFTKHLVHDGWSVYYKYNCIHVRCNAHHLRELKYVVENNGFKWAAEMSKLLCEINDQTDKAGGLLGKTEVESYKKQYDLIVAQGELECPLPEKDKSSKKRGRVAKGKARNLLERFKNKAEEILLFMESKDVPFTNNIAERAHRMLKVQQKISGCFRSLQGAKISCRIRSYIDTCRKNNITEIQALEMLFNGKKPDFMDSS